MSSQDLEAKIVVLGAQGVGKTSLLTRFIHNDFKPPSAQPPTIGANFLTKRLDSPVDASTIRLQIWDTAGQERFRSMSKLYYRGANAAILCYDITDERTFAEMGTWLRELREYNSGLSASDGAWGQQCVVHIVGTKADLVAEDPSKREVPFESCIEYVGEQLHGLNFGMGNEHGNHSPPLEQVSSHGSATRATSPSPTSTFSLGNTTPATTPLMSTNRSSGIWTFHDSAPWDSCHEISAKDGEGVEEVFRVIVRKLVEQKQKRDQRDAEMAALVAAGITPNAESFMGGGGGYFDATTGVWRRGSEMADGKASFRLTRNDKRRSWLGFPGGGGPFAGPSSGVSIAEASAAAAGEIKRGGRCC